MLMAGGGVNLYRMVTALALVATLAVAASFSIVLYGVSKENEKLAGEVGELNGEMEKLRKENAYHEEFYNRLMKDEIFAERVIRETLGYSGDKEIVFKFDDKTFSDQGGAGVRVEENGGDAQ